MRDTATILIGIFLIFLLALIIIDILMIVSLLKTGDERRQLIVWKASSFTLLVVVGTLVMDVVESVVRAEAMLINPFVKLSVTAMVYFLTLLFYRKRYGLSQEELAKKCGVSRQTVNAIENNKYDPTLALAFRLARELKLTVDELFLPS